MKKLFLIFLLFSCIACSSTKRIKWDKAEKLIEKKSKIKIGDIIIKERGIGWLAWFGHCGIVVADEEIAEYPQIGLGFYLSSFEDWISFQRKVKVLRLKNMSNAFRLELMKQIFFIKSKPYAITFDKKNKNKFYCSQFIWYVFFKAGKKFNRDIDLDSDKGFLVTPYDLLYSKEVEVIDLN